MKKEVFIIAIAIAIIIFSAFVTNFKITGYSVADNTEDKIDENLFQVLDNQDEVKVIVILNEPFGNKISGFATLDVNNNEIKNEYEYNIINAVSANVTKEGLKELQQDPNVKYVYLDHKFRTFLQDSVNIINASKVHSLQINNTNITGKNQVVCVLDTGVNYNHPDLINKVLDGYDFVNSDNDSLDDNGHGTHVAGIIAANGKIKGIAPDANLISIKVLDAFGGGYESDIIKGLEFCYNNKDIYNISVISMSLGTNFLYNDYCDADFLALSEAIDKVTKDNIFVLAAAGNNGNKTSIASPACISNVTAIGATTKRNAIASYSNRNFMVKLLAPGSSINSTYGNGYAIFSGTSMATPHVAGAIALLKQYNSNLSKKEIENLLKENGYIINENNISYSRIDVYSAILKLQSRDILININSPENKTYYSSNIELNYSTNGEYCWYSLNETNITIDNCSSIILNLSEGSYSLKLYSNDSFNNKNVSSVSFDINLINVNLINPENNYKTNLNDINFSCNFLSPYNLNKVDLILNNTKKESKKISGVENYTIFSIYNLSEGLYEWNCLVYDKNDYVNSYEDNYSFIIDTKKPEVNLINPDNNSILNTNDIVFRYTVNDDYNLSNCSLIVNDIINKNNDVIIKDIEQSFNTNLINDNYTWQVMCVDEFNNVNSSSIFNLIVNYTQPITQNPTPSGGGGGKHITPQVVEEPKISEVKENIPIKESNIKEEQIVQEKNNENKIVQQEIKQEDIGINNKYKIAIIAILLMFVLFIIVIKFFEHRKKKHKVYKD